MSCVEGQCVAGCVPDCEGKDCGNDGCGGSCGTCEEGAGCQAGQCVGCAPSCLGRLCGDDGCGGSCGDCPGNSSCQTGVCVTENGCVRSCGDRVCGIDRCGESCGTCGSDSFCAEATGLCVSTGTNPGDGPIPNACPFNEKWSDAEQRCVPIAGLGSGADDDSGCLASGADSEAPFFLFALAVWGVWRRYRRFELNSIS